VHKAGHQLHEKIALSLLASDGIAAIWQLHLVAARAYRGGHSHSAEILIETADAAERIIARRLTRRSAVPLLQHQVGNPHPRGTMR
jgi:hypothetical protein